MTSATLAPTRVGDLGQRFVSGAVGWWVMATLAVITLRAATTMTSSFVDNFGDTDDAARLIQVREFMAGAPWFDTTTYKLGGEHGLLSHWSRLIDLPLALLTSLFGLFMPADAAEFATRLVWPTLVLLPMLWIVADAAHQRAGRVAAALALAFVILSPGAIYQFGLGRIDHHNVMILGSVGAALVLWSRWDDARAWLSAGAMAGMALAIGYEALAPVVIIAGLPLIAAFLDHRLSWHAQVLVVGFATVFTLVFVATIPAARWLDVHCDALSLNMVVLAIAGAAGVLAAFGPLKFAPLTVRLAAIGAATAVGVAFYGLLEPACLAGPFGQMPASLWPIWMDHVAENQSILADVAKGNIKEALGLAATFVLGIALQTANWRRSRDLQDLYLLAVVAALALLAFWQFKYVAYGSWIVIVPAALALARMNGSDQVPPRTMRLAGLTLINQSTILMVSGFLAVLFAADRSAADQHDKDVQKCLNPSSLEVLNSVPSGLIAAHLDIGPFVAAVTHHRVLAAPYHRMPDALLAADAIFKARTPEEAKRLLSANKIDYVLTCGALDEPLAKQKEWRGALRADLVTGKPVSYLTPVPLPGHSPYRMWRVLR